jgi:hypothetical protein
LWRTRSGLPRRRSARVNDFSAKLSPPSQSGLGKNVSRRIAKLTPNPDCEGGDILTIWAATLGGENAGLSGCALCATRSAIAFRRDRGGHPAHLTYRPDRLTEYRRQQHKAMFGPYPAERQPVGCIAFQVNLFRCHAFPSTGKEEKRPTQHGCDEALGSRWQRV